MHYWLFSLTKIGYFCLTLNGDFLPTLTKDEDWSQKKNLKYLKGVVSRKDDVIFSCDYDPAKLDPNSVLAWEINYLETHGYEYVGNNIWSKK